MSLITILFISFIVTGILLALGIYLEDTYDFPNMDYLGPILFILAFAFFTSVIGLFCNLHNDTIEQKRQLKKCAETYAICLDPKSYAPLDIYGNKIIFVETEDNNFKKFKAISAWTDGVHFTKDDIIFETEQLKTK